MATKQNSIRFLIGLHLADTQYTIVVLNHTQKLHFWPPISEHEIEGRLKIFENLVQLVMFWTFQKWTKK